MFDRADAATVRNADDYGDSQLAAAAGVHLGQLGGDLVEPGEHKTVELDFADGTVAAQSEANSRADDAGLSQWGIHHPVCAELPDESVGHAIDAAQRADVFAHEQGLRVIGERVTQAFVDGLGNGHSGHQLPAPSSSLPSNPAEYSSNQAS